MIALLLAAAAAAPDACALLEGPEIAAVQGETPTESKPGASDQGALQVRSCVFVLPTFANSVSLEVTRSTGGEARRRWKELFHSRERGEECEKVPKRRVPSLGDEAFWLPEKPSGALYVLRKQALLRLSIGGPDPRHDKLARARALMKKALGRL